MAFVGPLPEMGWSTDGGDVATGITKNMEHACTGVVGIDEVGISLKR